MFAENWVWISDSASLQFALQDHVTSKRHFVN